MTTRAFLAAIVTPIAALALIAASAEPSLFLWFIGAAWFAFGVGGIAAAVMQAGRANEAEAKLSDAEDTIADLCDALAETTATLADARVVIPLRPVDFEHPDLTIVPPQRDGEHDRLPVADGYFPVHTSVDDDDIEALMRATEEN